MTPLKYIYTQVAKNLPYLDPENPFISETDGGGDLTFHRSHANHLSLREQIEAYHTPQRVDEVSIDDIKKKTDIKKIQQAIKFHIVRYDENITNIIIIL